ncbi:MAG: DEAD/DEAH box helicase, partial [Nitrososphaera sp.]|nr:DEAD/DEAH box helicase [Nitrososphaera sp.]
VPTGLFSMLHDACIRQWGANAGVIYDVRHISSISLQPASVPLRPYQFEAISKAFSSNNQLGWWPRAVIQVATGGGKTEMAVAMYQMHPVPTMFLVHRKDLLYQAQERFKKYGVPCGIIGDGHFDIYNPGVTIATMQTIATIFRKIREQTDVKDDPRMAHLSRAINTTLQVFFDEAHLMASNLDKGNQFIDISNEFISAYARWGLTATPFMRSQYDNLLLMGATGDLACAITNDQLIEAGYLSTPTVIMRKVTGTMATTFKGNFRSTKATGAYWREVEERGIKYYASRHEIIIREAIAGPHPCLILVKTIEQAESIKFKCAAMGVPFFPFLTGNASAAERRQAVADLRSGKLKALMATTIWDEGVDVPEIEKVILASGGKSPVKLLQRIGRGLRKTEDKNTVQIVDFQDSHHPMLKRHADERKALWKSQGFNVQIEK